MVLNISKFLERHLTRTHCIGGSAIKYKEKDLYELCDQSIAIFSAEPSLGKISPPCTVVGDIHGQYYDLLRMFSSQTKQGKPHGALATKYVFLGDYVDRGKNSLECISLILALKILKPKRYLVLRGNHECASINHEYGFYSELKERFGDQRGEDLWKKFNEVFNWLPLAGLIGKQILCMHGGISPQLRSLQDIENITRPLADVSTLQLAMDLLWADPNEKTTDFDFNLTRDASVYFGAAAVNKCITALNIKLIIRAHQMVDSGFASFANKKLFTIFTAPRYDTDVNNSGAVLSVDKKGRCVVFVLEPHNTGDECLKKFETQDDSNTKESPIIKTSPDLVSPAPQPVPSNAEVQARKVDSKQGNNSRKSTTSTQEKTVDQTTQKTQDKTLEKMEENKTQEKDKKGKKTKSKNESKKKDSKEKSKQTLKKKKSKNESKSKNKAKNSKNGSKKSKQ